MAAASSSAAVAMADDDDEQYLFPSGEDAEHVDQAAWETYYYNTNEVDHLIPVSVRALHHDGFRLYEEGLEEFNANRYMTMLNTHIVTLRRVLWNQAQQFYRDEIFDELSKAYDQLRDVRAYREEKGYSYMETPVSEKSTKRTLKNAVTEMSYYQEGDDDDPLPRRAVDYLKDVEHVWRKVFVRFSTSFKMECRSMLNLRRAWMHNLKEAPAGDLTHAKPFESAVQEDAFRALHDPTMTFMAIGEHAEYYNEDGTVNENKFIEATDALTRSPFVSDVHLGSHENARRSIKRWSLHASVTDEDVDRECAKKVLFVLLHFAIALKRNANIEKVTVSSVHNLDEMYVENLLQRQHFTVQLCALYARLEIRDYWNRLGVELIRQPPFTEYSRIMPFDALFGDTKRLRNSIREALRPGLLDGSAISRFVKDGYAEDYIHVFSDSPRDMIMDSMYKIASDAAVVGYNMEEGHEAKMLSLDLEYNRNAFYSLDEFDHAAAGVRQRQSSLATLAHLFTKVLYPLTLGLDKARKVEFFQLTSSYDLGGPALFRPHEYGVSVFAAEYARAAVRRFIQNNLDGMNAIWIYLRRNQSVDTGRFGPTLENNPHDHVTLLLECVSNGRSINSLSVTMYALAGSIVTFDERVRSFMLAHSPAMLYLRDILQQRRRDLNELIIDLYFEELRGRDTSARIEELARQISDNKQLRVVHFKIGAERFHFDAYSKFVEVILNHPNMGVATVSFFVKKEANPGMVGEGRSSFDLQVSRLRAEARGWFERKKNEVRAKFGEYEDKVSAAFVVIAIDDRRNAERYYEINFRTHERSQGDVFVREENIVRSRRDPFERGPRPTPDDSYDLEYYQRELDRVLDEIKRIEDERKEAESMFRRTTQRLDSIEDDIEFVDEALEYVDSRIEELERKSAEDGSNETSLALEDRRKERRVLLSRKDALEEEQHALTARMTHVADRITYHRERHRKRLDALNAMRSSLTRIIGEIKRWHERVRDDRVLTAGQIDPDLARRLFLETRRYEQLKSDYESSQGRSQRPQELPAPSGTDTRKSVMQMLRSRERRGRARHRTLRGIAKAKE